MEQITGQQHKVNFVGFCEVQDFLESGERVLTSDSILFQIAYMIVRGDEDSECVFVGSLTVRNPGDGDNNHEHSR